MGHIRDFQELIKRQKATDKLETIHKMWKVTL